jgi:hypothetical protein
MQKSLLLVPSVADEFANVQLGDERRSRRLAVIAESWSAAPDKSVLQSSKSNARAEGAYKFLNSRKFTYVPIVEAHVEETYERIAQEETVIVAHDTTEMTYQGEVVRAGLSRLRGGDQGFLAHVALAITGDGARRPLGVAAFFPWVRTGPTRSKKANGKKLSGGDYAKQTDKESERWRESVDEVNLRARGASVIHVMDREADAYPLLAHLVARSSRFVVRLSKDRTVRAEDAATEDRLKQAARKIDGLFELDVPISRRASSTIPGKTKTFAAREARVAKLEFAATTLEFKRPHYLSDPPEWLSINVVQVREVDPPVGVEPVEWLLATSEPVSTPQEVQMVVAHYRTRWVIEEYFKALKTGCAVEKRQHETYDTLLKAVAICLPIAWRLLLLRYLARNTPDAPAAAALSPTQIDVLRACSSVKLNARPTARQAFEAVALLGGHHKSNGDPGWLVLGRGMEHLLVLEQGWLAARRKDQIDD